MLTPAFFHRKSPNFAIKIYRYRLFYRYRYINTYFLVLLTYFESVEISLINMVAILMMSAKMASLGLLKIKVFWNKCCDVRIYGHDGTNHFLSCESNCMVMWPKFGNFSIIYMRERGVDLVLVEVELIGTGSKFGLEILQWCISLYVITIHVRVSEWFLTLEFAWISRIFLL